MTPTRWQSYDYCQYKKELHVNKSRLRRDIISNIMKMISYNGTKKFSTIKQIKRMSKNEKTAVSLYIFSRKPVYGR